MRRLLILPLSLSISLLSAQIDTAMFTDVTFTEPVKVVNCTLENGSSTQCYELRFFANYVDDDGPFCPATTSEVGGLGIYEPGTLGTSVGLTALNNTLWTIIENDGFDIVDANGTVHINDPGSGTAPTAGTSYCLQASPDDDLELVFLIPVAPEILSSPNTIESVELCGVSLDGIPINGAPPDVVGGGPGPGGSDVLMPALDPCGGHHDPAGYYHWHFIANSMNEVLTDQGITAVTCTAFSQNNSALMGFAMDGYPIYGERESSGSVPTGLDACHGHTATTPEFPSGIYHYHAVDNGVPNTPPCLVGASANNNFTYSFHENTLLGVTDKLTAPELRIYPNPVAGEWLMIETDARKIELFDMLGRPIDISGIMREMSKGFAINAGSLANGTYLVKATDRNGRVGTSNFIITQ